MLNNKQLQISMTEINHQSLLLMLPGLQVSRGLADGGWVQVGDCPAGGLCRCVVGGNNSFTLRLCSVLFHLTLILPGSSALPGS